MRKLITDLEIKELILEKRRLNYSFNLDKEVVEVIDNFLRQSRNFNRRFEYIWYVLIDFIFQQYIEKKDWSESKYNPNISHLFKVKEPMVKINANFKVKEMKLIEKMQEYFWFDMRSQFIRWIIINDLKKRNLLTNEYNYISRNKT